MKLSSNLYMTEKQKLLNDYLKNQGEAASILSSSGYNASEELIWKILQAHFDTGVFYADIFFKRLTASDMVEIVTHYLDTNGQILGEVASQTDLELIIDGGQLEKAIIKLNGRVWTVHKSDKDPFPSNPHAHDYDKNLKMHLGNGNIFKGKRIVGTMDKDNLLKFRKEVENKIKGISLPCLTAK